MPESIYPLPVPPEWAQVASEYHGGQWSGLYSIASTGTIHSWDVVCDAYHELFKIFLSDMEVDSVTLPRLYGAIILLYENDIGAPPDED